MEKYCGWCGSILDVNTGLCPNGCKPIIQGKPETDTGKNGIIHSGNARQKWEETVMQNNNKHFPGEYQDQNYRTVRIGPDVDPVWTNRKEKKRVNPALIIVIVVGLLFAALAVMFFLSHFNIVSIPYVSDMVERIAGDKHGGSGIVTDEHMSDEEQITGKANKTTDDSVPTTDSSISGYVSGSDSATNTVTKYADIATGTQKITGSVVDMADLLTGAEESYLTKRIEYIRDRYDFDIVIVTTPSANGKDIVSYCDDLYDYNGYGVGENRDGLLFCINLNDGAGAGNRDYYTSTRGFGITAFTDYAIADNDAVINSAVLPYLVDGDWHGAFDKYLDLADEFLNEAKNGIAYDVWHRYSP